MNDELKFRIWDALLVEHDPDELDRLLTANPRAARELSLLAELVWSVADTDQWLAEGGEVLMRLADVILKHGADLEDRLHEGLTPLMLAAKRGNDAAAEFLIQRGSILEARDDQGQNILHFAADGRDEYMMKLCLDAGLDPNLADNAGQTPLHILFDGSYSNAPSLSALLLSKGASVNAQNNQGCTALHLLAKTESYHWREEEDKFLRLLLNAGAQPFGEDADGVTPWSTAMQNENDRFPFLVRETAYAEAVPAETVYTPPIPEDIDLNDLPFAVNDLMERTGWDWCWCLRTFEAFHVALKTNDGPAVKRFLNEIGRRGDEFLSHPLHRWRRKDELTPLQAAATDGHINVVRAILDFGWWTDETTLWCQRTPLFFAVENGHQEIAALLLERGADVNERQPRPEEMKKDGNVPITTALHEAASHGDASMVKLLLAHGANHNARDRRGDTPLHTTLWMAFGAKSSPSGVADALVEAGANLLAVNGLGQIPLAAASTAEARLTEQIMNKGIVGETLRQALVRHHLAQSAQALTDARYCLGFLRINRPQEEWRIGLMVKDVQSESGARHNAGDVVLLHPCHKNNWMNDNWMVVRPKPEVEMPWKDANDELSHPQCYDNMVLGVRASNVMLINGEEG